MSKTNIGLVDYCKHQLGRPYWLGTFGQVATAALYNYNKSRLPSNYTASDFPKQYGQRVHDCIGLVKGYIWSDGPEGIPLYASNGCPDINETEMYSRCKMKGAMGTMPDIPGILVFFPGHVGVYIGNGKVIEARGHAYGVVTTNLESRGWKNWGKCPYIEYVEEDEDMTGEQIYEKLNEYLRELPLPDWAKDEFESAKMMSITDGTRPCELIPRYQAAIMAKRAAEVAMLGKK